MNSDRIVLLNHNTWVILGLDSPVALLTVYFPFLIASQCFPNCSAAESIVQWEPGYTHRLHCSIHFTTASKSDHNVRISVGRQRHSRRGNDAVCINRGLCSKSTLHDASEANLIPLCYLSERYLPLLSTKPSSIFIQSVA